MDDQIKISCRVSASEPGLRLAIRIDDQVFFDSDPYQAGTIEGMISDNDGEHRLMIELSGKTRQHTQIDQQGNILRDVTANVEEFTFDDIQLGHIMAINAVYEHDTNGTGPMQQHKFYGTMGCNGTVTLPFTTPVYLWLLENM